MIYIFVDVGGYWQELSGPAAIYSRYYPKPFEHKLPVHVVERAYMGGWTLKGRRGRRSSSII